MRPAQEREVLTALAVDTSQAVSRCVHETGGDESSRCLMRSQRVVPCVGGARAREPHTRVPEEEDATRDCAQIVPSGKGRQRGAAPDDRAQSPPSRNKESRHVRPRDCHTHHAHRSVLLTHSLLHTERCAQCNVALARSVLTQTRGAAVSAFRCPAVQVGLWPSRPSLTVPIDVTIYNGAYLLDFYFSGLGSARWHHAARR